MKFGELVEDAAAWLGLPEIAPLKSNEYKLVFDETFEVLFLSEKTGSMIVYSHLANLPEDSEKRVDLLKSLLRGNIGPQRLKTESILSLDQGTGEICLFQELDHRALNTQQFIEIIESYLNQLGYWKDYIGHGEPEPQFSPFYMFR
jgi:hypothetical protein